MGLPLAALATRVLLPMTGVVLAMVLLVAAATASATDAWTAGTRWNVFMLGVAAWFAGVTWGVWVNGRPLPAPSPAAAGDGGE